MTNFEINMANREQKRNRTRIENTLKEHGYEFQTEKVSDHFFISVFPVLDGELSVSPTGQMSSTMSGPDGHYGETFDTMEEIIKWVEEYKVN